MIFDKNWFEKWQGVLLFLLNCPVINIYFRFKMRMWWFSGFRIQGDISLFKRISKFAPHYYEVANKDGSITWTGRTHAKYAKRIHYAFIPLWKLFHAFDMNFANLFFPKLNLGFDTLTVYPQTGSGGSNTSCDGFTRRTGVNQTLSNLLSGVATTIDVSSGSLYIYLQCSTTTNQYSDIIRNITIFDVGRITNITSAYFSIYPTFYAAQIGAFDVHIVDVNPASTNNIVISDHGQFSTTIGGNVVKVAGSTIGSNLNTYNSFADISSSIQPITKIGISISNDVYNVAPSWYINCVSQITISSADTAGITQDPKLVVTYTTASTIKPQNIL